MLVNGTCIEINGAGVLLRGASGAGKSDLALRLLDDGGARLVADDYTLVRREGSQLIASPPPTLRGLLEVRGIGIIRLDAAGSDAAEADDAAGAACTPVAVLVAVIDLVAADRIERLPEPDDVTLLGQRLPLYRLCAFEASSTAKVRLVTRIASRGILVVR